MDLLLGCDPEVFLKKAGKFIGAEGIIPGTKEAPYVVNNGGLQVDGMAAEFGIEPAATSGQFISNINSVMKQLRYFTPEIDIEISPVAMFDDQEMNKASKKAKELGCNPDWNAYSMTMNPPPTPHPNMRTASGHVHLGWCLDRDIYDDQHLHSCGAIIRQLDFVVGVPTILLEEPNDRRKMYGKAGAFRPKPYGVEYRTPSNWWLKEQKYMRWMFNACHQAFDLIANQGVRIEEKYDKQAQTVIDNSDKAAAEELMSKLKKEFKIKMP